MYKPFYVKATRIIPIKTEDKSKLYSIDKKSGTSNADAILEFCKVPRSRSEISKLMGKSSEYWVRRGYILPLVDSGRLVMTMPDKPQSPDNKFVVAENSADIIMSPEGLVAFCKTPRTKREIYLHFGLSAFQLKPIFNLVTSDGRLLCTDPTNAKNHWQRFVAADSDEANITNEAIERFCEIPRTRAELVEFLDCDKNTQKRYIHSFIKKGIIKMLKPEVERSIDQRFISVNKAEGMPTLNTDEVAEFCRTPRSRQEIAEQFNLLSHNACKYINDIVEKGKLKMTMPLTPSAQHQRYTNLDTEVIQLTEEAVLEFCKTPRKREDIYRHFGFPGSLCGFSHLLYPLINAGKLTRTHPIGSKVMKFVTVKQEI